MAKAKPDTKATDQPAFPARQGDPNATFTWNAQDGQHEGQTGADGLFQPHSAADVEYATSRGWLELDQATAAPADADGRAGETTTETNEGGDASKESD
jgi:hypothetical protein